MSVGHVFGNHAKSLKHLIRSKKVVVCLVAYIFHLLEQSGCMIADVIYSHLHLDKLLFVLC